ncbi:MAG: proteasome accessory factor PafA2 family protein [Desulfomonile tiedjei]|uniref:Proteasome accessory factor PafA2 family protein n=1 Tax=Desulfomonile tiedjei TaxID=2358 RepID=A0A9D6Z1Y0_9BACT|nr:proteasome accessory factor PafA2 family protein [Desulfomonile tiedjei]
MKSRIFGTECEYALFHSQGEGKSKSRWEDELLLEHLKGITQYLMSALKVVGYPLAGEFLGNGGRFYIDRGAHPEYATPECASVSDVVAHEKAGDRIVWELAELAGFLLAQAGKTGKLHVFKNNVDAFGTTYGCHENYLVAPRAMESISFIVPFLVTRQIFTGAGRVMKGGTTQTGPFQLSQRADFIDRVFSDRTSQVRGIINLRKREIPRQGQNRRLHILVGDSNMSEYALGLRAGTTSLVLRLLEEDAFHDMPVLESSVEAMKDISRRFDCPVKLENRQGRYNALDIQTIYLEKVHRFFGQHEPGLGEEEILQLWSNTLTGLRKVKISSENWTLEDDPEDLKRRIDWILKLWLINRVQQNKRFDWQDYRLQHLDARYHDLDPVSGIFQRCQELNLTDRMVNDNEIRKAKVVPPDDTRAWTRGMTIQSASGKNVDVIVQNWETIDIVARPKGRSSNHPFDRHRRMVNRLEIKMEDPLVVDHASILEKVRDFVEMWD